jgi:hypothetical protein
MSKNFFGEIFVTLVFIGAIWAVIYNFYMAWFRSSEFLENSVRWVKDWWPFAGYFRSYYSSSKWLWITRIGTTVFMLAIIFMAYRLAIGQFSLFP